MDTYCTYIYAQFYVTFSTTSVIILISQKVIMQCDVCSGVIYISNTSKYLKAEMRYATAEKTNLYNLKYSFKYCKSVSFKPIFSFHIPFKKNELNLSIETNLSSSYCLYKCVPLTVCLYCWHSETVPL